MCLDQKLNKSAQVLLARAGVGVPGGMLGLIRLIVLRQACLCGSDVLAIRLCALAIATIGLPVEAGNIHQNFVIKT